MVVLPYRFVATRYPGYFWDFENMVLYSIKMDGILKPLKHIGTLLTMGKCGQLVPQIWEKGVPQGGYKVSVEGCRRTLTDKYLHTLKPEDSTIKVSKKRASWILERELKTAQQSLDF